ncbi:MAG: hypothetical protein JKP98_17635 [Rhodobacteraceae bacterium]|nr:hypothetical protein [Paracoccaceae bacterium]
MPPRRPLAAGHDAVCIFVNDICNAEAIATLADCGVRLILCRSAGYNQVDLAAARRMGLTVMRVPGYSPESVAEHGRPDPQPGPATASPAQPGARRQLCA